MELAPERLRGRTTLSCWNIATCTLFLSLDRPLAGVFDPQKHVLRDWPSSHGSKPPRLDHSRALDVKMAPQKSRVSRKNDPENEAIIHEFNGLSWSDPTGSGERGFA